MRVNLKVRRFNPEADGEPFYQTYQVDSPEYATVLDALIQVREEVDSSLALRCSCRSAICGSCAMRINGQARLACKAKVVSMAPDGGEIVVDPPGNMPVIKDLVVDMQPFWEKVQAVTPWLQPSGPPPEREYLVPNSAMLELAGVMNCIMCGACVSDCTVLEIDKRFLGPAALAKAYRFLGDPRDGADVQRLRDLNGVGGIWDCTRCNYCVEVCPKGVRPMDRIMQLREAAVQAGMRDTIGYRHGEAFAGSVRVSGRLNEASFLARSVGFWNLPRLLQEIPGALRLLRAGKLPWKHATPLHEPIPGYKSVRRLMDRVRRGKVQKEVPA